MIGEAIGPFAIRSSLGRGGFGEVWLAEHRETGDRVAIKVMTPEVSALPVVVDMVADARAIARVVHHGIARIYDAGVTATKRAYIITGSSSASGSTRGSPRAGSRRRRSPT